MTLQHSSIFLRNGNTKKGKLFLVQQQTFYVTVKQTFINVVYAYICSYLIYNMSTGQLLVRTLHPPLCSWHGQSTVMLEINVTEKQCNLRNLTRQNSILKTQQSLKICD